MCGVILSSLKTEQENEHTKIHTHIQKVFKCVDMIPICFIRGCPYLAPSFKGEREGGGEGSDGAENKVKKW